MEKHRNRIIYAVLFLIMICIYGIYHGRVNISSDTTTTLPMAKDILQGNLALRDWVLGSNNFYFTEIIVYTVGLLMNIPYTVLLNWIPGIFYSLIVLGICRYLDICVDNLKQRLIFLLSISCVLLLVPYSASYTLLNANSHNNLYAFLVGYLLLISKYLNTNRESYLAGSIIIAVLMSFSEGVTSMVLTVPMGLWCLGELIEKKIEFRKILVSVIMGWIGGKLIFLVFYFLGGMETRGYPVGLANWNELPMRLKQWIWELNILIGVNQAMGIEGNIWKVIYVFLGNFVLFVWLISLLFTTFFYFRISQKERILYWITVVNVGACWLTSVPVHHRYIAPGFIFGMVLLALNIERFVWKWEWKRGIVIALALVSVFFNGSKIYQIAQQPPFGQAQREVAALLEKDSEVGGYGDFWCASQISYFTNYKVRIYPVFLREGEMRIMPYSELINKKWYGEDNMHFVILPKGNSGNFISTDALLHLCGEPEAVYQIDTYEIYYWKEDISQYLAR